MEKLRRITPAVSSVSSVQLPDVSCSAVSRAVISFAIVPQENGASPLDSSKTVPVSASIST